MRVRARAREREREDEGWRKERGGGRAGGSEEEEKGTHGAEDRVELCDDRARLLLLLAPLADAIDVGLDVVEDALPLVPALAAAAGCPERVEDLVARDAAEVARELDVEHGVAHDVLELDAGLAEDREDVGDGAAHAVGVGEGRGVVDVGAEGGEALEHDGEDARVDGAVVAAAGALGERVDDVPLGAEQRVEVGPDLGDEPHRVALLRDARLALARAEGARGEAEAVVARREALRREREVRRLDGAGEVGLEEVGVDARREEHRQRADLAAAHPVGADALGDVLGAPEVAAREAGVEDGELLLGARELVAERHARREGRARRRVDGRVDWVDVGGEGRDGVQGVAGALEVGREVVARAGRCRRRCCRRGLPSRSPPERAGEGEPARRRREAELSAQHGGARSRVVEDGGSICVHAKSQRCPAQTVTGRPARVVEPLGGHRGGGARPRREHAQRPRDAAREPFRCLGTLQSALAHARSHTARADESLRPRTSSKLKCDHTRRNAARGSRGGGGSVLGSPRR